MTATTHWLTDCSALMRRGLACREHHTEGQQARGFRRHRPSTACTPRNSAPARKNNPETAASDDDEVAGHSHDIAGRHHGDRERARQAARTGERRSYATGLGPWLLRSLPAVQPDTGHCTRHTRRVVCQGTRLRRRTAFLPCGRSDFRGRSLQTAIACNKCPERGADEHDGRQRHAVFQAGCHYLVDAESRQRPAEPHHEAVTPR